MPFNFSKAQAIYYLLLLQPGIVFANVYNESSSSSPRCSQFTSTFTSGVTTSTEYITNTRTFFVTAYQTSTGDTESKYVARGYANTYPVYNSTAITISPTPSINSTPIEDCFVIPDTKTVPSIFTTQFSILESTTYTLTMVPSPVSLPLSQATSSGRSQQSSAQSRPPGSSSGSGSGPSIGSPSSGGSGSLSLIGSSSPPPGGNGPERPPMSPSNNAGLSGVPVAALDVVAAAASPSNPNGQSSPQLDVTPVGTKAESEGSSTNVQLGAEDAIAAGAASVPTNEASIAGPDGPSQTEEASPGDVSEVPNQSEEFTGTAYRGISGASRSMLAFLAGMVLFWL